MPPNYTSIMNDNQPTWRVEWINSITSSGTAASSAWQKIQPLQQWHATSSTGTVNYTWATTSTSMPATLDTWHKWTTTWEQVPVTPRVDRLRQMIRRRSAPLIIGSRQPPATEYDDRELRARDTLRRVVGEDRYRRFLKCGFVSLKAKSGRVYLIYPDHKFTRVFSHSQELQALCVVLPGKWPPTDSLITRYLMLLNDEQEFVCLANRHREQGGLRHRAQVPATSLLEEAAALLRKVG